MVEGLGQLGGFGERVPPEDRGLATPPALPLCLLALASDSLRSSCSPESS